MPEQIIYFEEDASQAQPVIEFFEAEGSDVLHFTELPDGGVAQLSEMFDEPPFLLLMDINVQQHCGFDLCLSLKEFALFQSVPVLFISDSEGEEHILQAYEVGAFDYLTKPVQLKSLAAKCSTLRQFHQQAKALQSQISISEQMAFDAMVTSSDLGNIIRFHENVAEMKSIEALGHAVLKEMSACGISSSIMFGFGTEHYLYFSDDQKDYLLEQKVYKMLRKQGRVYSWKNRTLFNYDSFSVLARSMPVEDELRYGALKDHICMLLNGVEPRFNSIVNEKKLKRSQDDIRYMANTIARLAMDMQSSNQALSAQFEKVITDMEVDISEDLSNLNLMSHEEAALMDHVKQALADASSIFNTEKEKEAAMAEVLLNMVEQLEKKSG